MSNPGGGPKTEKRSNRVRTGAALFRPGELERPGRHATARDLRRLRGAFYLARAELERLRERLELSPNAVRLVVLLVALPRPHGRPLGVGLQTSAPELAAVLGCCTRTVHNARAELAERGLLQHSAELRRVSTITRARRPEHRLKHFYGWARGELRRYQWAHVRAVDFPTPRALTLLDQHAPERHHAGRAGVWGTLRNELAIRLARFDDPARAADQRCTPYNVELVRSRFALRFSRFAVGDPDVLDPPNLPADQPLSAGSEGERTRAESPAVADREAHGPSRPQRRALP